MIPLLARRTSPAGQTGDSRPRARETLYAVCAPHSIARLRPDHQQRAAHRDVAPSDRTCPRSPRAAAPGRRVAPPWCASSSWRALHCSYILVRHSHAGKPVEDQPVEQSGAGAADGEATQALSSEAPTAAPSVAPSAPHKSRDKFHAWEESARRILSASDQEARRLHAAIIGVEHLWAATLLCSDGDVSDRVRQKLGITPERVRAALPASNAPADNATTTSAEPIGLTKNGIFVIERAVWEARYLRDRTVRAYHLLLALAATPTATDALFARVGVSPEKVLNTTRKEIARRRKEIARQRTRVPARTSLLKRMFGSLLRRTRVGPRADSQ